MINVIGLGYIGLPTALMFAKSGMKIIGTDINEEIVESLNNGKLTVEEKGMEELFQQAIENGIEFSTKYQKTDTYIITVPTPYNSDTKKLNQEYLISSINSVLDIAEPGSTIIIESTVSPGSIDKHIRPEIQKRGLIIGTDIHLAHAPERIIPGNMVYELEYNARTIGADDYKVGKKIKELYGSFCKAEIVITDIRSAEMSKVVENTFRDVNIAFANELAKICRADDMDVYEIIDIANKHPRVDILQPGPGVGGHCISVDPWFLVGDYPELTNLILTARNINDSMPEHVLSRMKTIMTEKNITDYSKVGLYGLSYKEDVDDTRESPTLQLIDVLKENNIEDVKVFDPLVKTTMVDNQYFKYDEFIKDIELLIVMVAHKQIKTVNGNLNHIAILDTKNVLGNDRTYRL